MATRCTIYIKGLQQNTIKLYHHYDWYLSGVWKELIQHLQEYWKPNLPALLNMWWYEIDEYTTNHTDLDYIYTIEKIEDKTNVTNEKMIFHTETRKLKAYYVYEYKKTEKEIIKDQFGEILRIGIIDTTQNQLSSSLDEIDKKLIDTTKTQYNYKYDLE